VQSKIEAIVSDKKAQDRAEVESAGEDGPVVTEADIANIVAQWTGIPVEKVSSDETGALPWMPWP
jgi:ATP-dependent Clp protease ATP-binding subunit ClpC